MARLLMICGGQRNGSTAMLETLGGSGELLNCGEFLHSSGVRYDALARSLRLDAALNYFAFAESRRGDLFASLACRRDARRAQWAGYLEHLDSLSDRPWIGLNVKYGSWRCLDHVWQDLDGQPFLVDLLIEAGAKFVLLNRRAVILQALSERRAAETGLWHATPGKRRKSVVVAIDPAPVLMRARRWRAQAETLTTWLSPYDFDVLDYEDVFDGGRLSAAGHGYFAGALGLSPEDLPRDPPLARLSGGAKGWLANADEVADEVARSEFADEADLVRALAAEPRRSSRLAKG